MIVRSWTFHALSVHYLQRLGYVFGYVFVLLRLVHFSAKRLLVAKWLVAIFRNDSSLLSLCSS